jgi:hypothetical protein
VVFRNKAKPKRETKKTVIQRTVGSQGSSKNVKGERPEKQKWNIGSQKKRAQPKKWMSEHDNEPKLFSLKFSFSANFSEKQKPKPKR